MKFRRRLLQLILLLIVGGVLFGILRVCCKEEVVAPSPEALQMQALKSISNMDEALPKLKELYNYGSCSPEALTFIRERLLVAAREQNVDAQLLLAETYVCENAEETLFWWTIVANNTFHPEAQFALGCALGRGYGGTYGEKAAKEYLTMAKSQGHAAAYLTELSFERKDLLPQIPDPQSAEDYFMRGLYAAAGHNQTINLDEAEAFWEQALEMGYQDAGLFLGAMALKRNEPLRAVQYLEHVSTDANPAIDTLLASLYVERLATPKAKQDALIYLQRAIDAKFSPAMYLMGEYALKGKIVPPLEPYRYFRLAVETHPFPLAAYAYGNCLYKGEGGVEASPEKALPWVKMAAEASILPAQWMLVKMYREGIGVPQDRSLAEQWEKQAQKADSRPPEKR